MFYSDYLLSVTKEESGSPFVRLIGEIGLQTSRSLLCISMHVCWRDNLWALPKNVSCISTDDMFHEDLCFGNSVNAIDAPGYEAPILKAMDASLLVFIGFKNSPLSKEAIMNCPPNVSRTVSQATSGLVDLQQVCYSTSFFHNNQTYLWWFSTQLLKAQIRDLIKNPEGLSNLPHSTTVSHELLRPEAYLSNTVPSADSFLNQSQALLFGGADTIGITLMHGSFYVLSLSEADRGASISFANLGGSILWTSTTCKNFRIWHNSIIIFYSNPLLTDDSVYRLQFCRSRFE